MSGFDRAIHMPSEENPGVRLLRFGFIVSVDQLVKYAVSKGAIPAEIDPQSPLFNATGKYESCCLLRKATGWVLLDFADGYPLIPPNRNKYFLLLEMFNNRVMDSVLKAHRLTEAHMNSTIEYISKELAPFADDDKWVNEALWWRDRPSLRALSWM